MNTWDEGKRRANIKVHGIDFADLERFFDGDLLTREDKRHNYDERRYLTEPARTLNFEPGTLNHAVRRFSARKAANHEYQAWLARYAKH